MTIAGQSFTVTNLGGVSVSCAPTKVVGVRDRLGLRSPDRQQRLRRHEYQLQVQTTTTNRNGSCGNTFWPFGPGWRLTRAAINASCSKRVESSGSRPRRPYVPADPKRSKQALVELRFTAASDIVQRANLDPPDRGHGHEHSWGFWAISFTANTDHGRRWTALQQSDHPAVNW